jgi:glycosidase
VVERRRFEGNADVIEYLDPVRVPMTRVAVSDDLDRWTASHQFDNVNVYAYYFELAIGGKNYVYTNNDVAIYWTAERGSFGQGRIAFAPTDPDAINRYRQTVYSADYTVPDYAADIVYYYVFPERFRNGDPANDPQPGVDTYLGGPIEAHDDWLSRPYVPGSGDGSDSQWNNDFFGGDLDGLIEKLDYLQELGVNAIYSTPIFEAGSNHKYDTGDYLNIDGNFGTNEDFETLTREAAARGIRVIVDVSLNHSGSDSVYFDRYSRYDDLGAYEGGTVAPASPWADFYQFNGNSYVGWAGFDTLPELAESDAWKEFAFRADDSVTDTWLDRGASGWRMDVTPWVSDDFWREWRQNVKANDPNALTVAETWFDASKYFLGDTFDSTMNYIFRNSVMDFARGQDAAAVYENIELMREAYPPQAFYALMNLLSTHDAARALHEFGYTSADSPAEAIAAAKQRLRLAVLFQMTFPGAPTVFYGDEVGVRGGPDPDNRATYPWADLGGTPDTALLDDFKELIALRHDNDVLRRGTIGAPLHLDENVIVLAREYEGVLAITAYNNGTAAREVTVEVPAEFADRQMKDALTGGMVAVDGDQLTLAVPAVAGTVLISQAAPDTTRPAVTLVSPSTEGPFRQLRLRVDASDEGGLKRIVANVYRDGSLVKSTQSPMGGAKTGSHTATVSLPDGHYTVRYNAHDLAGNVSRTGTFAFVIDATKPTATVKAGANFTVRSGNAFEMVSYKLHDAGKIDRIELNGVVKDLTNNPWSDVNFIRPGVFGAVRGTNTLRVYDVAGNWRVYRFTLV